MLFYGGIHSVTVGGRRNGEWRHGLVVSRVDGAAEEEGPPLIYVQTKQLVM